MKLPARLPLLALLTVLTGTAQADYSDHPRAAELLQRLRSDFAFTPADLDAADEAFLTGSTREISPVVAIDDRVIGTGKPGPITLKLLEVFRRMARAMSTSGPAARPRTPQSAGTSR